MIRLPWPDRRLHPNARVHFRELAKVKQAERSATGFDVINQLPQDVRESIAAGDGPIALDITFRPPDKRRRDLDGMLAASKALLDGLADALLVDDYRFELSIRRGDVLRGGAVDILFPNELTRPSGYCSCGVLERERPDATRERCTGPDHQRPKVED